eukprot:scaffold25814_cov57-Cyclotella_meneghiniana.AAC.3
MSRMFEGAKSFNQPLNDWNVQSVENMSGMFKNAESFNQPLNKWKVGNVIEMAEMFYGATKFNQPLNGWNVEKVVNMAFMFYHASEFNGDISNWSPNYVKTMRSMFDNARVFNKDITRSWYPLLCRDFSYMFKGASKFNQSLCPWKYLFIEFLEINFGSFKWNFRSNIGGIFQDSGCTYRGPSVEGVLKPYFVNFCAAKECSLDESIESKGIDFMETQIKNNLMNDDNIYSYDMEDSILYEVQSEDPEDNYDHVENDHYHIEEDSSVTHAKDETNDNDVALPLVLNKGVSGRDPDSILGDISHNTNIHYLHMQVYDSRPSQLFKIKRVQVKSKNEGDEEEGEEEEDDEEEEEEEVYQIYSSEHPKKVISLADNKCSDNTDIVLWSESQHDYAKWKITPGGTIENYLCKDIVIDISAYQARKDKLESIDNLDARIQSYKKNDEWGQKWNIQSDMFDPSRKNSDGTPMKCKNKGLWHLGISDEACENAGGNWTRTPCITLKETIDERPSRFDLNNPVEGNCQTALHRLDTAFVSASTSHKDFKYQGCVEFCQSLPDYSVMTSMETARKTSISSTKEDTECTCFYPNDKLPSRELMPTYVTTSPSKFTLVNSNGMALGLRPKIDCDAADELTIETQVGDPSNPRQQFGITRDGRVVSVRCPEKVLTAVLGADGSCAAGASLQISKPNFEANLSPLQQWTFHNDGTISNVKCPDLSIASSKEKDVKLKSIYFSLQNERTQLAIGVKGAVEGSCMDGMALEMQDLEYGSPNQQFIYDENEKKITSLMCPDFAITISNNSAGDCSTTDSLVLSNQNHDDKNKWLFDNNIIQSLHCTNLFITISGDIGGRTKMVTLSQQKSSEQSADSSALRVNSNMSPSPKEDAEKKSNQTSYTEKELSQEKKWEASKPASVGSLIVLSSKNSERYQKWSKQHQLFHPMMGPFSIVNPQTGQAITVEDKKCSSGLLLTSEVDDPTNKRQQFYLGQHGSIFMADCPGLVLSSEKKSTITLEVFKTGNDKLKWKFVDGTIESVSYPGMVLVAGSAGEKVVISTQSPTERPSANLTERPSANPTERPSANPTERPSSANPTERPSSANPTDAPSARPSAGPLEATFDKKIGAPRCAEVASSCDTGSSMIAGRGEEEQNNPNTIDNCADGSASFDAFDVNRIIVRSGGIDQTKSSSPLEIGRLATIITTVQAYKSSTDWVDFFFASDASNPQWQLIKSVRPSKKGVQDLRISYTIPAGSTTQAVRVQIGYWASAIIHTRTSCDEGVKYGSYFDRDDLVFDVTSASSSLSSSCDGVDCNEALSRSMSLLPPLAQVSKPSIMITLQDKNSAESSQISSWRRINTRLMQSNKDETEWKQSWMAYSVNPAINIALGEFLYDIDDIDNVECYNSNPAFSASFDAYAKELIIKDDSDEDQCRKVREQLGFDKDHPFDTEVRDKFHEHQCDPFFTGVDHTSGLDHTTGGLGEPPKFEMVEYTPVEYEAVEYEEKEYTSIDYEEFSKGDDLGDLTETSWPDLYIPVAGRGDLTDSAAATDQESLAGQQDTWLLLGHLLVTAEQVYEFTDGLKDDLCKSLGASEKCIGALLAITCVPNPAFYICRFIKITFKGIAFGILTAATLAFQVIDHMYEKATLGPNTAIYGQYYDRANYLNIRGFTEWNEKALDTIRLNMKDQHQEMKRQLQERHKDIANHVGQDIADAQNALGEAIVDAQNDLGQGIVDAQNALGQGIVNAQNALGQSIVDTSNYITKQHNIIGDWLHESLCEIYRVSGGSCHPTVGPLEEDQSYIPMQLHWPEGQLNMMEKIDQLHTILPLSVQDNLMLHDSGNSNVSSAVSLGTITRKMNALSSKVQEKVDAVENKLGDKVNVVESKVDSLTKNVQDKVDSVESKVNSVESKVNSVESKVNSVESKVDAVQSKVDAVQSKVDALSDNVKGKVDIVQDELKEIKDMLTKLMGTVVDE